jgi:hypothetical protein
VAEQRRHHRVVRLGHTGPGERALGAHQRRQLVFEHAHARRRMSDIAVAERRARPGQHRRVAPQAEHVGRAEVEALGALDDDTAPRTLAGDRGGGRPLGHARVEARAPDLGARETTVGELAEGAFDAGGLEGGAARRVRNAKGHALLVGAGESKRRADGSRPQPCEKRAPLPRAAREKRAAGDRSGGRRLSTGGGAPRLLA